MNNVIILYQNDGLANSQRAMQLSALLEKRNIPVKLVNTPEFFNVQKKYFHPPLEKVVHYYSRQFFLTKWFLQQSKKRSFIQVLEDRANILSKASFFRNAKVIICQNNMDFLVGLKKKPHQVFIFDSPTPFSYELEYSPNKNKNVDIAKLREIEKKVFVAADKVVFNWEGYRDFYEEMSGVKISNYLVANSGTTISKSQATFLQTKKIIFLGSLHDYWVNKPLLKKLLTLSKIPIDVYGKTSDPFFLAHPNYKGYLDPDNQDILSKYHFGLISISNDPLRNKGFSAKQMLYISYGLPLLVPEWRNDSYFESATIKYNTENFNTQLEKFSSQKMWLEKNAAAVKIAKNNQWENNFKNLVQFIAKNEK